MLRHTARTPTAAIHSGAMRSTPTTPTSSWVTFTLQLRVQVERRALMHDAAQAESRPGPRLLEPL